MKKNVKQALTLGFGLSTITQQQVNKFVKEIMKKQGISEREAEKLAREMIQKSKETQQKVNNLLVDTAGSIFRAAGLATKKDLDELKKELKKKGTKSSKK